MKRFIFSLDRVLDFKDQMLDKEKGTLASLRREKREIDDAIDACQLEFEQVNSQMLQKTSEGATMMELRGFQFRIESGRYEMKTLRLRSEQKGREVEKQLEVVLAMTRDVSGLEKLREKQRDEYDQALAKADELEISEFICGKLVRQREAYGASI